MINLSRETIFESLQSIFNFVPLEIIINSINETIRDFESIGFSNLNELISLQDQKYSQSSIEELTDYFSDDTEQAWEFRKLFLRFTEKILFTSDIESNDLFNLHDRENLKEALLNILNQSCIEFDKEFGLLIRSYKIEKEGFSLHFETPVIIFDTYMEGIECYFYSLYKSAFINCLIAFEGVLRHQFTINNGPTFRSNYTYNRKELRITTYPFNLRFEELSLWAQKAIKPLIKENFKFYDRIRLTRNHIVHIGVTSPEIFQYIEDKEVKEGFDKDIITVRHYINYLYSPLTNREGRGL